MHNKKIILFYNYCFSGPGSYSFGYDTEDSGSGNMQFRQEKRKNDGSVTGSYGHLEPDGNVLVVHYVADGKGYRYISKTVYSLNMLSLKTTIFNLFFLKVIV